MLNIKQIGKNLDYPNKAIAWKFGEKIPEWLSDRARILDVTENGLVLFTRKTSTGEIEIVESGGVNALVTLKSKNSYVIYSSTHPLISLTEKQLKLLYEIKKEIKIN